MPTYGLRINDENGNSVYDSSSVTWTLLDTRLVLAAESHTFSVGWAECSNQTASTVVECNPMDLYSEYLVTVCPVNEVAGDNEAFVHSSKLKSEKGLGFNSSTGLLYALQSIYITPRIREETFIKFWYSNSNPMGGSGDDFSSDIITLTQSGSNSYLNVADPALLVDGDIAEHAWYVQEGPWNNIKRTGEMDFDFESDTSMEWFAWFGEPYFTYSSARLSYTCKIKYSDNGTTWTTSDTYSGSYLLELNDVYMDGFLDHYSIEGNRTEMAVTHTGAHRYWKLDFTEFRTDNSQDSAFINELEFSTAGVVDETELSGVPEGSLWYKPSTSKYYVWASVEGTVSWVDIDSYGSSSIYYDFLQAHKALGQAVYNIQTSEGLMSDGVNTFINVFYVNYTPSESSPIVNNMNEGTLWVNTGDRNNVKIWKNNNWSTASNAYTTGQKIREVINGSDCHVTVYGR